MGPPTPPQINPKIPHSRPEVFQLPGNFRLLEILDVLQESPLGLLRQQLRAGPF